MRVPLRWLNDVVETGLAPTELAHRLTMAGLEAEKIESVGAEWDGVFVGLVERVDRHPNADRLVLATVDGGEQRLTVVTGAPNVAAGQKVALAIVGARLIDGHSDELRYITLKPNTIRGVASEGMVCSEKELGLSEEHEGILVLDPAAPIGAPLAEWLGETVIEFEITPNRVDAFSVLGIARDAAALTGCPIRLPDIADVGAQPPGEETLVRIEDPDLCPHYLAAVIEGVRVGPSPDWLARRLIAAGLRPINNIVDVTNYVMLEWGQPLHAFDHDRLGEGRIVVRRAHPGETIETLDHQRRVLSRQMLVIADAERAVAVAGVIGGVDSEVDERTTTVLLEAANFDMKSIRHTARSLKVRTDASARFERGIDPNLVPAAAGRAIRLILDVCPGSRVVAVRDAYPGPLRPREIAMRFSEFERLLGVRYELDQVREILTRLGFDVRFSGDEDSVVLGVTVPTYRSDVSLPADVVEEVARIGGYESLPERLPSGRVVPVRRDPMARLGQTVRNVLIGSGGYETVTYVTSSEDELRRLASDDGQAGFLHRVPTRRLLRLRNPQQSERPLLRPTLIPALLTVAAENLKHEPGLRLFEIARVYLPEGDDLPREASVLGIVLAGRRDPLSRFAQDADLDYFDLKGLIEAVIDRFGLVDAGFEPAAQAALHPGRAAWVRLGSRTVGLIGELRPDRANEFGIEATRVGVAELDLDALLAASAEVPSEIRVPRYLPVAQDFAIVVSDQTPAADVERALLAGAGALATGVALFDVYRGPQLGEGRKSLAYRVTFTAPDRPLTDADLAAVRDRIGKALRARVQGELRS